MASHKLSNNEKQTLTNVIELYRDMPYLWDKNDKNYMNKNVREEGYKVLLGVYKTIEESATLKTLKKKLDNMRSNFYKELKKVKSSKHTGAGNDDVYTPTVWYYDHFKFLESSTNPRRSVADTMDMDQNSSGEEESLPKTVISGNTSFKKRKRESPYDTQKTILEKASKLMDTKEMDWEILGKCVGMQLRDLDPRQQTIARKLISDVIFYGTLNKLTEEWFVGGVPIHNPPNIDYTVNSRPIQNPAIVNTVNPVSSPETPQSDPSLIYNVVPDPVNPEFYEIHIPDERQIITEGKADIMKEFLIIKKERK